MPSRWARADDRKVRRMLIKDGRRNPHSYAFDKSEINRVNQSIESPSTPDENKEYDYFRAEHVFHRDGRRVQSRSGKTWLIRFLDDACELWVPKSLIVMQEGASEKPVAMVESWWVRKQDELQ